VRFATLPVAQRDRIRDDIRECLTQDRREQPRVYVGQPAELKKEIDVRVLTPSLLGRLFSVSFSLAFESEHRFVFTLPRGAVRARGLVPNCEVRAEGNQTAVFVRASASPSSAATIGSAWSSTWNQIHGS
jgi:hypothetical protein